MSFTIGIAIIMVSNQSHVVSVLDFLRTYASTNTTKPDYGVSYLHRRGTLRTLLDGLPYPNRIEPDIDSACKETRRTFRLGKRIPKSVRALESLAEIGINFPLRYDSNLVSQLFTLFTINLVSGSLDQRYHPRFYLRYGLRPYSQNDLSPFKFTDISESASKFYLILQDGKIPLGFGRLLNCMGCPKGEGTYLMGNYKQIKKATQLADEHFDIAKAIINVMLIESLRIEHRLSGSLRLPSRYNKENAEDFAGIVKDLFEKMFPESHFSDTLNKGTTLRRGQKMTLYYPIVHLNARTMEEIMDSPILKKGTKSAIFDRSQG